MGCDTVDKRIIAHFSWMKIFLPIILFSFLVLVVTKETFFGEMFSRVTNFNIWTPFYILMYFSYVYCTFYLFSMIYCILFEKMAVFWFKSGSFIFLNQFIFRLHANDISSVGVSRIQFSMFSKRNVVVFHLKSGGEKYLNCSGFVEEPDVLIKEIYNAINYNNGAISGGD